MARSKFELQIYLISIHLSNLDIKRTEQDFMNMML